MLRGTIYAYKPRTFFASGETLCLPLAHSVNFYFTDESEPSLVKQEVMPVTSTKMPFGSDIIFDRMSITGTIISITAVDQPTFGKPIR